MSPGLLAFGHFRALHREFSEGLLVEKFLPRPALQVIFLIPRPTSAPVE